MIAVVLLFESIHPLFGFFSVSRFMVAQHCLLMFAVFCCVNLSLDVSGPMTLNFRLRLDETLCARMLLNARTFRDLRCTAQICGAPVLDWTAIQCGAPQL